MNTTILALQIMWWRPHSTAVKSRRKKPTQCEHTCPKKKKKKASLCDIPLRKALKALLYKKCTGWIETAAAWGTRCQCEESCLWGSLYQRSSYSSFQSSDKACKHILLYRPQEPQQIRTDLLRYPLRYCRKYNNRSAPKMVFRFSCKVKHLHTHSNS